jgi:AcrR family transcriptional regulator
MPRNFSEADRDSIRAALIAAGRSCFLRYGLRRTKVEELAESAGIAKGTFYHFFSSKEDLCMEIFDIEERAMKEHVAGLMAAHKDARETVEALLRYGIGFATGDSLLVVLRDSGEYALLARGVPPETLARHIQNDVTLAERFLADLRRKGVRIDLSAETLAGVLRAVTMLTFHQKEIGADVFSDVVDRMIDWISHGLASGENSDDRERGDQGNGIDQAIPGGYGS